VAFEGALFVIDLALFIFKMQKIQKHTKIKHKAGHESSAVWTQVEYFCPSCGAKGLWEDNHEDYEVGTAFLCLSCEKTFAILENGINEKEQVLKQMRGGG
jgi:hypothetical protein